MKIKTIKNIAFINDVFICPKKEGICISKFELQFESGVKFLGKDHCDCIGSIIDVEKNTLEITLVTEENEIDEFIIFHLRKKNKNINLKIRFKR